MKNASVFLIVSVLTLSVLQNAYGFSGQGSGTEQDPYIITNVYQLQEMNNDLDAWYELGNDIDASDTINWNGGSGFVPIGNDIAAFTGTFDGHRFRISKLCINRDLSLDYVGLFGYTSSSADIKNASLTSINISGRDYVGSVVGWNQGSIKHCRATNDGWFLHGDWYIGGLVGYNSGLIQDSCFEGSFWGPGLWNGGLVGWNSGTIKSSYFAGVMQGNWYNGGLVGENNGTIQNCYSTGNMPHCGRFTGGLVGRNYGEIQNSYSSGTLDPTGTLYSDELGGLVWENTGTCNNSYWDIETSGLMTSAAGEGKTTAKMQTKSTFTNVGWDFVNTWTIFEGADYPRFLWQGQVPQGLTIYVDNDAPNDPEPNNPDISDPLENGSSEHPYDAIQKAIDATNTGDTVVVASGRYTGNGNRDIDFNRKAITVRSTIPNGPDIVAATIIDCQQDGRGFNFHSGEAQDSILSGLTVINGNSDNGGGIYCESSSPTVTNCIFSRNSANVYGGGIFNSGGSPTVTNCTFSGNSAGTGGGMSNSGGSPTVTNCTFSGNAAILNSYGGGGGMSNNYSSPTVTNCIFSGNSAIGERGGGMSNYYTSNPTVTNCTFSENSAGLSGGGMHNCYGTPTVVNCTFSENSAGYGGGMSYYECGIYYQKTSPTVTNCTFSGNSAGSDGGGIVILGGIATITNSLFWGDTSSEIAEIIGGMAVVNFSDIQGGWSGEGNNNINADPLFVNPDNDDFHLLPNSPCIDEGDPNYVAGPNETDLDGNPRVVGSRIDMGAYEYQEVRRLPDLEITSEDINFVPLPGEPCQPVTISATIWNVGTVAAENVEVMFKDFEIDICHNLDVIGLQVIPRIEPGESQTVSIEHAWPEASFRLITVIVDPSWCRGRGQAEEDCGACAFDLIKESDETNNSASKVYQVGDMEGMPVSIEVSCSAPISFAKCRTGTISGTASYRIPVTGHADYVYPVKGGSVDVAITDSNGLVQATQQLYTNATGAFSINFSVPLDVGNIFEVGIVVTDSNFTGRWEKSFNVIECRDISIGGIAFSKDNPDPCETITITATVYADAGNTRTEPDVPVTFYVYPPGGGREQIGQVQHILEMLPGASQTVSVDANFPSNGGYYIQVVLEPGFGDDQGWNNQADRSLQVGPQQFPFITVTASPRLVYTGDAVNITVDTRAELLSGGLDSITVKDSAGQNIPPFPLFPGTPEHDPCSTRWVYRTDPLPEWTATGTAVITVTATDSNEITYIGYGYFDVASLPIDFYIRSEDVNFSSNNPHLGDTIIIDAVVHADGGNAASKAVPVTFYAHHPSGETYKIGSTLNTGEITPGGAWSVSTSWCNAAEGGYIIEAVLGPGFSDDNYWNNVATRALVVGDYPFVAYFEMVSRTRIDRTTFRYECKVILFNNSPVQIRDVELELLSVPPNMTVIDPYVTYASIGALSSATSADTCTFETNRQEEIDPHQIIWRARYKVEGSSDTIQQVFSNFGPLPPITLAGDITGDGTVDFEDLIIMAEQWLSPPGNPSADIAPQPNGDGVVNFLDFAELAENWLK
jgi:hypothetical protein